MKESIFIGIILGLIFTVAICASGYENEVRDERIAKYEWQMEVRNGY